MHARAFMCVRAVGVSGFILCGQLNQLMHSAFSDYYSGQAPTVKHLLYVHSQTWVL